MPAYPFSVVVAFLLIILSPTIVSAALTFDASVKEVYENNINPVLSGAGAGAVTADPGKQMPVGARLDRTGLTQAAPAGTGISDFYTVLSATLGAQAEVGVETELAVKAEFTHYWFAKFTELNAGSAAVSTTVFKQFSDVNSMRIGITAKMTAYEAEALDAGSLASTFDLKQQLSLRFWLQEGMGLEKSSANDNEFSYTARSFTLRSGYRFSDERTFSVSYAFHERKFMEGAKTFIHAVALSETRRIAPHLQVAAVLERQWYETVPAHVHATDTITSVAIVYSF